ncbi:MAG: hypothetical protein QNJ73_12635, partial [Gammaproteobacteria bacterium]|nr:hypothetical protein [Gammaproteobacteria bacterium]
KTGVPKVSLPTYSAEHWQNADIDRERIQYFDEHARIIFYADGRFGWQILGARGAGNISRLPDEPFYLIAAKKVRLHVKGVVNGKVLVYSPERITIEDDLTYADSPNASQTDNYLGLVCDKNIEVAPPQFTGPGDLRVEAAIYARKRFVVRDYNARTNATLFLHGSLTAGSLSATEPRYRVRQRFDRRFPQTRPPQFPLTDRYAFESWDASWQ